MKNTSHFFNGFPKFGVCLLGLIALFSIGVNAQTLAYSSSIRLNEVKVSSPFIETHSGLENQSEQVPSVLTYIGGPVHYKAFFCNFEQQTQKKLGIMIKVHAGDYDNYTKEIPKP